MGFNEAFDALILHPLRDKANKPGTETYKIVRETVKMDDAGHPVNAPDGEPVYEVNDYGDPVYDEKIRQQVKRGQGCYGSTEELLWYAYCYMPMHVQVLKASLRQESNDAKSLRDLLTKSNGDLLIIDVGCGPLTAGVAISDWYIRQHHEPIKLSYVAIDPSEACLSKAAEFAGRADLFELQAPLLKYDGLDACHTESLVQRVTQQGIIVFLFSYLFGQDNCNEAELKKIASFVSLVMQVCKPQNGFIVYTNSTYSSGDTNDKYAVFKKHLGSKCMPLSNNYFPRVYRGFADPDGSYMDRLKRAQSFYYLVEKL